jgi:quercetin dioxygenase-like cupin family protein
MRNISCLVALLSLGFAIAGASACGGGDDDVAQGGQQTQADVTREILQSGFSDAAPGQMLELTRVVIPPAKDIAPHTHPGPQLALIVEGTLSYSVRSGEVQVKRSGSQTTETIAAGQAADLKPGDSLAESPGMVHTARNAGPGQVVILISALFPAGVPASSPAPSQ